MKWTALAGAGAILIALGIILFFPTQNGIVKFEIDDPSISVRFKGETISINTDGRSIDVTPTGKHTFEILQDGVTIDSGSREVTVQRGQTRVVKLTLLGDEVAIDGKRIEKPLQVARTGWHGWPVDAPSPAIAPFNSEQAKVHQEAWAKHLKVDVEYTNSIGMTFRLIPPGEFIMGSSQQEIDEFLKLVDPNEKYWQDVASSEAPQHKVILTHPIYLGVHEVTQANYEQVMGTNPSHFASTGTGKALIAGIDTTKLPVETVSWNDAADFCAKLSQQEKRKPFYLRTGESVAPLEGTGYRLPTEAEWEFACRAGTTTRFWTGDRDDDLLQGGWYGANSGGRTHCVGELPANPFGLHDMHGNPWEWIQDWWQPLYYGQFQDSPAVDPRGPSNAVSQHVMRGGGWYRSATECTASRRGAGVPTHRHDFIGFRVSLPVAAVKVASP